jgi:hypothetical protein
MALTLYVLPSTSCESIFGSPMNPTPKSDLWTVSQNSDCSEFLVLSNTAYDGLQPFTSYDGFTFTYCQEWGLSINDEVVTRVKHDIRSRAYPNVGEQFDILYHQGFDAWKDVITAVKLAIPLK